MNANKTDKDSGNRALFLVIMALIVAGIILLADAFHVHSISKLTVRLGIGLLFSAIALIVGKNRPVGIIALSIVWISIIITFLN